MRSLIVHTGNNARGRFLLHGALPPDSYAELFNDEASSLVG